jgi:CheY-like chemotaxis protein
MALYKILYIDDDQDDIDLLTEALSAFSYKYELISANNGEEGIATLKALVRKSDKPCLIILDINMPVMDGKQTFQKLKEDKDLKDIPVVIFSTSSNRMDIMFFEGEKVAYMTKPVRLEELSLIAGKMMDLCDK